jgi:hypothetical protein
MNQALTTTVGSKVFVSRYGYGILRFLGKIPGQSQDDVAGVELERDTGHHDGLYRGHRYFVCKQGHGIVVSAKDIQLVPNDTADPVRIPTTGKFELRLSFVRAAKSLYLNFRSFTDMISWYHAIKTCLTITVGDRGREALSRLLSASDLYRLGKAYSPLSSAGSSSSDSLLIDENATPTSGWFHGLTSRVEAENYLAASGMVDGTFLVRETPNQPGRLVISLVWNQQFQHIALNWMPSYGSNIFPSIVSTLLQHLAYDHPTIQWSTPLQYYIDAADVQAGILKLRHFQYQHNSQRVADV